MVDACDSGAIGQVVDLDPGGGTGDERRPVRAEGVLPHGWEGPEETGFGREDLLQRGADLAAVDVAAAAGFERQQRGDGCVAGVERAGGGEQAAGLGPVAARLGTAAAGARRPLLEHGDRSSNEGQHEGAGDAGEQAAEAAGFLALAFELTVPTGAAGLEEGALVLVERPWMVVDNLEGRGQARAAIELARFAPS